MKLQTFVIAIIISVVLSIFAAAFGAPKALEEMFLDAPANSKASANSNASKSAADLNELKAKLAELESRLGASNANGAAEASLMQRLNQLEQDNAWLRKQNTELAAHVADLKTKTTDLQATVSAAKPVPAAGAAPAGPALTPEQMAALNLNPAQIEVLQATLRETAAAVFDQKREEERQARRRQEETDRLSQIEQLKKAAEANMTRAADFIAQRMNIPAEQANAAAKTLSEYAVARAEMNFTAWKEDWDQEKRKTMNDSLRNETTAKLTTAGFDQQQTEGMMRMSQMMDGGRGGFGGPQGGFGQSSQGSGNQPGSSGNQPGSGQRGPGGRQGRGQ